MFVVSGYGTASDEARCSDLTGAYDLGLPLFVGDYLPDCSILTVGISGAFEYDRAGEYVK